MINTEKLKNKKNMCYSADLFVKACADPHGLSDDCYPDGTPMTNYEKYLKSKSRDNDFH